MSLFNKKSRVVLVMINLVVWSVILGGFVRNKWVEKSNEELIASHHELLKEVNSFSNYEDYKASIPFMETKMTESVMKAVCPIIPEAMLGEFPKPKVTKLHTTDIQKIDGNKKKLITQFSLSINDGAPFIQKTESVYEKQDNKWMMISYRMIF